MSQQANLDAVHVRLAEAINAVDAKVNTTQAARTIPCFDENGLPVPMSINTDGTVTCYDAAGDVHYMELNA